MKWPHTASRKHKVQNLAQQQPGHIGQICLKHKELGNLPAEVSGNPASRRPTQTHRTPDKEGMQRRDRDRTKSRTQCRVGGNDGKPKKELRATTMRKPFGASQLVIAKFAESRSRLQHPHVCFSASERMQAWGRSARANQPRQCYTKLMHVLFRLHCCSCRFCSRAARIRHAVSDKLAELATPSRSTLTCSRMLGK